MLNITLKTFNYNFTITHEGFNDYELYLFETLNIRLFITLAKYIVAFKNGSSENNYTGIEGYNFKYDLIFDNNNLTYTVIINTIYLD